MDDSTTSPAPRSLPELHERASRPTAGVLQALQTVDSDVLVLGAGGKMGFHLSRLLQRGLLELGSPHRVLAVSRFGDAAATAEFTAAGIGTIAADLLVDADLARLPASRNVFFLAGVKFGTKNDPQRLRQMNVELPARVAQRFVDARIVALSTGCVYAFTTPASGGSRESDPPEPPGDYAQSCLGREQAFAQSGAAASLIRLNYSVDLRYGVLVDVALKVLRGQPIDLETGWFNTIWQGDANAYIVQALPRAASPPWIVNVTGEAILQVAEVARRFGERFGREPIFRGSPAATAWLSNAALCHRLWGPPQVSESTLIEWVADWLSRGGETLHKPTQFEVRDGAY